MKKYDTVEFDNTFDKIPNIKYRPWIGKNYQAGFKKKKILVIAESVYDWNEEGSKEMLESKDFSRRVVREHGLYFSDENGVYDSSTYRNFERMIYGKRDISEHELETLWSSVALHQYIQRSMSSIEERPTAKDYTNDALILKKIISEINPDYCILMGTDWNKIKPLYNDSSNYEEFDKINGAIPRTLTFNNQGVTTKIIAVKHPSHHFSWNKWHEFLLDNLFKESALV